MDANLLNIENIKVIALSGRLDSYTVPESRKLIEEALSVYPPKIVINMQAVSFMDSTALSTFVMALKRSKERGGNFRLCCLQQPVRMIFELTRLDRVFEIFVSEQEAVQAFID